MLIITSIFKHTETPVSKQSHNPKELSFQHLLPSPKNVLIFHSLIIHEAHSFIRHGTPSLYIKKDMGHLQCTTNCHHCSLPVISHCPPITLSTPCTLKVINKAYFTSSCFFFRSDLSSVCTSLVPLSFLSRSFHVRIFLFCLPESAVKVVHSLAGHVCEHAPNLYPRWLPTQLQELRHVFLL